MRRLPTTILLTVAVLAVTATAALGHASFREREVPADSEQTLVLRVPEERDGEETLAVETLVPAGFEVVDCPSEDGWTCEVADEDEGTVLSWKRDRGGEDAMLSITVRTPAEPGDHRWPTIQTYDSGTEVGWTQDEGDDRPAPVLTVAPAGAAVVEDTEDPADHSDDDATGAPVAPDESVPPTAPAETEFTPPVTESETGSETVAPVDPTATAGPEDAADEDGGVPVVAVLVVLAILAAAIGAARMIRRGPAGGDPGGATTDPYDPEA